MKKYFFISLIFIAFLSSNIIAQQYKFESVPGDALNARIYKLDNGLTVYITVYKNEPRVQTCIAVRAGSKNDPSETTGMAHYFEHMMFKGTKNFGTTNYAKESIYIARIDSLFEVYRKTIEETKRESIYHLIDSISQMAAQYAIPNEYDKLMSVIGANGTNAFTSLEETVFVEDIPSNQIDNWAAIQYDRFSNSVLRLFHTEIETVFEEKNMSLTNDRRKSYESMLAALFPNHPYGTQTTLGKQEHLKNPSMKNLREFYEKYYVPNNMAICISGDVDPDETIKIIDKYFGKMKPSSVPPFTFKKESPIQSPIVKEVVGQDAENITIAYRFNGVNSVDADMITMIDMILTNSNAGLMDLNLIKKQTVLGAGSYPMIMKDYSALVLTGKPKSGQTLEQVKDLLLSQIELLKNGEFPDWLMNAIINDLKLKEIKDNEDNNSRAMAFVDAFIMNISWKDKVEQINRLSKISKGQIIEFANKYLANNYIVVYKRTGKDDNIAKIIKPKITPIKINRDDESAFLKTIQKNVVPNISPVFVDYDKDIQKSNLNARIPLYYKSNTENNTFSLYYVFNFGTNHDKMISMAINYIKYLGTSKYTAEQISEEFYKLGCSFNVSSSYDQTYVSLTGLSENMGKAITLFEHLMQNATANSPALENLVKDILKNRSDNKLNVQKIFSALVAYGYYGSKSQFTNILSEKELKAITPDVLLNKIKSLFSYNHHILFYGNENIFQITDILNKMHIVPKTLMPEPAETIFPEQPTDVDNVLNVNYTMKQAQIYMLSRGINGYNKELQPELELFNEYFGGSMNSLVFQELREAKALAYSAMSYYQKPSKKGKSYYSVSYIATQADKLGDALSSLNELLNNMPVSEKAFNLAKESIIQRLRTERITKSDILWNYESAMKLGLDYDIRRDVFEKLPNINIDQIKAFHEKYLKNKTHTYLILGDDKSLDLNTMSKYGKVKTLQLEEIFGY